VVTISVLLHLVLRRNRPRHFQGDPRKPCSECSADLEAKDRWVRRQCWPSSSGSGLGPRQVAGDPRLRGFRKHGRPHRHCCFGSRFWSFAPSLERCSSRLQEYCTMLSRPLACPVHQLSNIHRHDPTLVIVLCPVIFFCLVAFLSSSGRRAPCARRDDQDVRHETIKYRKLSLAPASRT
jgi:hypothetical protein